MKTRNWWRVALMTLISAVALFPIYITVVVSLKPQTDLSSFWVPPRVPFWENFAGAFAIGRLGTAFMNTAIITALSVVLVIGLGAMASYPLARHRSRLNAVVTTFMLSILMVPGLSLLVPLYVLLVRIRGISTYWGVMLVHVTFNLPLAIFLYLNFIRAVPRDLDEAALIDGSSVYAVFYRIILPLLKPVTVSVIILTGVAVWNDYQFSLYFLQAPAKRVITLAISSFFAISGGNTHIAAAAAVVAIVPITIVYVALQRYFVQGVLDSALK
ncbi:MAG TPA: carbohydrate ABC transporter permease [Spirochaetia bacterium]